MTKIRFLGVTPARGGSKGIPRKNIKPIAGKPLLAWTIEAAKKSNLIDKYIVSTEDGEIADVARRYEAEVLPRPSEWATDKASTLVVIRHAVETVPCDAVVLLQATSPVRDDNLIDKCIGEFMDGDYDSLATGFICKYRKYGSAEIRRQDIKGFFYDDGNVYVIKSDLIRSGDRFGKKIKRVVLDMEQNLEIDDDFDFWLAEQVLLKRQGRR